MRSTLIAAALSQVAVAATQPRNFIYIIPGGMSPASQTLAKAYEAMMNGEATPQRPLLGSISIDQLPVGNVRTHSANNLVIDSGAATTTSTSLDTLSCLNTLSPKTAPPSVLSSKARLTRPFHTLASSATIPTSRMTLTSNSSPNLSVSPPSQR